MFAMHAWVSNKQTGENKWNPPLIQWDDDDDAAGSVAAAAEQYLIPLKSFCVSIIYDEKREMQQ